MLLRRLVLAAALSAGTTVASAAGLQLFEIPAAKDGPAIRVAEWSPCAQPAEQIEIGPFTLPAVRNCPIMGSRLPLIVLSHGYGGSYLGHHDTAETLADAGFIVVALNHPDDTATNREKRRSLMALRSRPTDVHRLLDFMLERSPDAAHIDARRIGFFGFSRGGYTGLVLAGAIPDFRQLRLPCAEPGGGACPPVPSMVSVPADGLRRDSRIQAFVIADPLASVFPTAESVSAVTAPVQLWGSESGSPDGALPEDVATVARHLPAITERHVVKGAGHFAFLTLCPPVLAKAEPDLCSDGPNFDRAAFHEDFNTRVVAFFRTHLPDAASP